MRKCIPVRNFLLNALLLLLLVHAQPAAFDDGVARREDSCPAFEPFRYWALRQCPPMTDFRCVIGLPGDLPPPLGQLICATADDLPDARLKLLSAREMLALVKYRDPAGRPWCMLSLFYSPDCVFSAKVADSFYQVARQYPKLRVIAVDVSQSGKDTESLISQYGIASTPVIALWQDGFPRYRLYDDYSRSSTLTRVIRAQTDLRPKDLKEMDEVEREEEESSWETGRQQFLTQFKYLQEDVGFDWYLLAAVLTCLANFLYLALSSIKGREVLQQHFPGLFGIIVL